MSTVLEPKQAEPAAPRTPRCGKVVRVLQRVPLRVETCALDEHHNFGHIPARRYPRRLGRWLRRNRPMRWDARMPPAENFDQHGRPFA